MNDEIKQEEENKAQKYHTSRNDYSQNKEAMGYKRFAAISIDTIIMGVFYEIFLKISYFFISKDLFYHLTTDSSTFIPQTPPENIRLEYNTHSIILSLIMVILWLFFYYKPLKIFGQSIGKRLLKIRLLNKEKQDRRSYLNLFFRELLGKPFTYLIYSLPGLLIGIALATLYYESFSINPNTITQDQKFKIILSFCAGLTLGLIPMTLKAFFTKSFLHDSLSNTAVVEVKERKSILSLWTEKPRTFK